VGRGCRLVVSLAIVIGSGACSREVTPAVVAGVDACRQCGMVIDHVNQACGYEAEGEFVTFDSPMCLLRSYEARRAEGRPAPVAVHFADYHDASFHVAEEVTFLLTDRVPTVMEGRVLCFASHESAAAMREHPDDVLADWVGFRTRRGRPDVVVEVVLAADGMAPEVVEAAKGDLVLLRARGQSLDRTLAITVTGYPEAGTVSLPTSGDEVEFRILAQRPGAGFPIIDADTGDPLGRLRISGAHTMDEEAM
jgi:hypothetical protein